MDGSDPEDPSIRLARGHTDGRQDHLDQLLELEARYVPTDIRDVDDEDVPASDQGHSKAHEIKDSKHVSVRSVWLSRISG